MTNMKTEPADGHPEFLTFTMEALLNRFWRDLDLRAAGYQRGPRDIKYEITSIH